MDSIHTCETDSVLGAPIKLTTMPRWQRKALEQQSDSGNKTPRKTPSVWRGDQKRGAGGKKNGENRVNSGEKS